MQMFEKKSVCYYRWNRSILLVCAVCMILLTLTACGDKRPALNERNGIEITAVSIHVNGIEGEKEYGTEATTVYTLTNHSDQSLVFEGIGIKEFDAEDKMLDSYESYTKNYQETELASGESMDYEITFDLTNGLDHVENLYIIYKEDVNGDLLKEEFTEPYVDTYEYE